MIDLEIFQPGENKKILRINNVTKGQRLFEPKLEIDSMPAQESKKIRSLTSDEIENFYREVHQLTKWTLHSEDLTKTALNQGKTFYIKWISDSGEKVHVQEKEIPFTMKFIRETFPGKELGRAYWHKLEPGEKIDAHQDFLFYSKNKKLESRYQVYLTIPKEFDLVLDHKTQNNEYWSNSLIDFALEKVHYYKNQSKQTFYILVFDIVS